MKACMQDSNEDKEKDQKNLDFEHDNELVKQGYLSRLGKGGWSQRWLVLDKKSRMLREYKYPPIQSTKQASHNTNGNHSSEGNLSHDAKVDPSSKSKDAMHVNHDHDTSFKSSSVGMTTWIDLAHADVSLSIQGEALHSSPTPFCFFVNQGEKDTKGEEGGKGGEEFRLCAESTKEFMQWTNAIAACIHDDTKVVQNQTPPSTPDVMMMINNNKKKKQEQEQHEEKQQQLLQPLSSPSSSTSFSSTPSHQHDQRDDLHYPADMNSTTTTTMHPALFIPAQNQSWLEKCMVFRSGRLGYAALLLVNPLALLLQLGDWQVFALIVGVINLYHVWILCIQTEDLIDAEDVGNIYDSINNNNNSNHPLLDKMKLSSQPSATILRLTPSSRLPSFSIVPASGHRSGSNRTLHATSMSTNNNLHASDVAMPSPTLGRTKSQVLGNIQGRKAKAGSTVPFCPPAQYQEAKGQWTTLEATRFNVRHGPNYSKHKQKRPSQAALLHLVGVDIVFSENKIDNVGSVVALPDGPVRDFFIINCQVPNYAPSNPLWGEKQGDGPGFNLIMYFVVPETVRSQMNDTSNRSIISPSIKLLKDFMQLNSPLHNRFKAMGIVENPTEPQLSRGEKHLLDTYNGKPILTRPQHRFFQGTEYFEVDVDAHEFNYIARKGLSGVTDHMNAMIVDFGFVIEGQTDDELPEQILGCVRLCKVNLLEAPCLD